MSKSNEQLCKWLIANSSGVYRPAAEAADRIKELEELLIDITQLSSCFEHKCKEMVTAALLKYT